MNKKPPFKIVSIILFILFFLVVPKDVVWGGQPYQTVPTIGPSRTPTTAFTATQVVATNTQVVNTQPVSSNPTSTNTAQVILRSTVTPTSGTLESQSATSVQKTTVVKEKEAEVTQAAGTEATSSVLLPMVSVGDGENVPSEGSEQEVVATIPAFVFPLIVVLLLVIFYLILKLVTNRTKEIK